MFVAQKIEIPQKLKDELIKKNLPLPDYRDYCIPYNILENDTYTRVAEDSELYNKANIDRRLFSKIRSDKNYHPSLGTVTLLALALNLSTEEYGQLLNSAFYSLPTNTYSGITLKYCFDNKLYDVYYVNNLIYTLTDKEIKDL